MKRLLWLPLLALSLLAASWSFGHFDVRSAQLERNYARWASLPGPERDALRERWSQMRLALRDGGENTQVLRRRMGSLNRLLQRGEERQPDPIDLATQLERLPARLQTHLGVAPELQLDAAELLRLLRADTSRRMDAFLGNLSHEGQLRDGDLAEFYLADWDSKVELALGLLKREALFFESEEPRAELAELSPLDLVARQAELRRQRGLIGRAGRLLQLSEEQARELYSMGYDEFEHGFRDVVRPAARRLLIAEGVSQERVDVLVARPYRSLERMLERLLQSRRKDAR